MYGRAGGPPLAGTWETALGMGTMKNALHQNSLIAQFARDAVAAVQIAVMLFWPALALAGPDDPSVAGGEVTITNPDASTTLIQQGTDRAIVNWHGFSIDVNELVQVQQPGADSVLLNHVTGGDPSNILGSLVANGRVFIVNPNGVVFGPGSSIDAAGILATTFKIDDADFMGGHYNFAQDPNAQLAAIINQGEIRVSDGGFVFLVAPAVANEGLIIANLGQVVLGAGQSLTVDFMGDGLITYEIDGRVLDEVRTADGRRLDSAVSNSGAIEADGGTVVLSANAGRHVFQSVVSNTGRIEANSLEEHGGVVRLEGGDPVENDGLLGYQHHLGEVQNAEGVVRHEGTIDVSAAEAGALPGEATISGEVVYVSGSIAARGAEGADGGDVLVSSSLRTIVTRTSSIDVSGDGSGFGTRLGFGTSDGGNVVLWSDHATRYFGRILGQGADGGQVEVSGHDTLVFRGDVDLTAAGGTTGTLLLDPLTLFLGLVLDPPGAGEQDPNLAAGNDVLFADADIADGADTDANANTITTAQIALLPAAANVIFEATDTITILDQPGGVLPIPTTAGNTVRMETANPAGGGIVFADVTDTITTAGGNLSLLSASTLTLGNLNAGAGTVTTLISVGAAGIDLRNVTAGALVVSAPGAITDVAGSTLTIAGTTSFNSTGGAAITINDTDTFGSLAFFGGVVNIAEDDATILTEVGTIPVLTASAGLTLTSTGGITDTADTDVSVTGAAVVTGGAAINLVDDAGDSWAVTLNASFTTAGAAAITVNAADVGVASFGSLAFNGAAVNIFEDDGAMLLSESVPVPVLTATAGLTLGATGTIADAADTDVTVTGAAVLTATGAITLVDDAGDSWAVTGNASFSNAAAAAITINAADVGAAGFGSLAFNGLGVNIFEDDGAMLLTESVAVPVLNSAAGLTLGSNGTITDAADTDVTVTLAATLTATTGITLVDDAGDSWVVGGNISLNTAGAAPITMNAADVGAASFGSLAFNGSAVNIFEDDAGMQLAESASIPLLQALGGLTLGTGIILSDAADTDVLVIGSATVTSGGIISLVSDAGDSFTVTGNASFSTAGAGPITINPADVGAAGFGSLAFNGTAVNVFEDDGAMTLGESASVPVLSATVVLTLGSSGTIGDLVDTDVIVGGAGADVSAVGAITLVDDAGDSWVVGGNATFRNGGAAPITVNAANVGAAGFGSLAFNGSAVNIFEDDGAMLLAESGTVAVLNASAGLTLGSSGTIADAADTDVTVTGAAALTAVGSIILVEDAGDSWAVSGNAAFSNGGAAAITINAANVGAASFGSLGFNGGAVTIFEDDGAVNLAESATVAILNAAGGLTLTSSGSIIDAADTDVTVTGNATLTATAAAIILVDDAGDSWVVTGNASFTSAGAGAIAINAGDIGAAGFGSLAFNGSGVNIFEDDGAMLLAESAAVPVLTATGGLTLGSSGTIADAADTDVTVTGAAAVTGGGAITLVDDAGDSWAVTTNATFSTAGAFAISVNAGALGAADFGTLTFNGTATTIRETSDMLLTGASVAAASTAFLTSTGSINDAGGAANVTATSLSLVAATGIGDFGGPNPLTTVVTNLEATTATGGIFVSNTGALTLVDINTVDDIAINVTAAGNINITALSPLTVLDDVLGPADITLTATESAVVNFDHLTIGDGVGGPGNVPGLEDPLVMTTGVGATILLQAGDDIRVRSDACVQAPAGNIVTTPGFGDVDGDADVFVEPGGCIDAFNVTVNSPNDIFLGQLTAAGTLTLNAGTDGTGSIIDLSPGTLFVPGANNIVTATLNMTAGGNTADYNQDGLIDPDGLDNIPGNSDDEVLNTSSNAIEADITAVTLNLAQVFGIGAIEVRDVDGDLGVNFATTFEGNISIGTSGGTLTTASPTFFNLLLGIDAGGAGNINVFNFAGDVNVGDGNLFTLPGLADLRAAGDRVTVAAGGLLNDGDVGADTGSTRVNVTAFEVVLVGGAGVGVGNPIDLQASFLAGAIGGGGFFVLNKGSLTIADLSLAMPDDPEGSGIVGFISPGDMVDPRAIGNGIHDLIRGAAPEADLTIQVVNLADPSITVAADILMAGTILLEAFEGFAPGAGDDITVLDGVRVTSTAEDVIFHAGDNISVLGDGLLVDGTVAAAGEVRFETHFGDNDLLGTITVSGIVGQDLAVPVTAVTVNMFSDNEITTGGAVNGRVFSTGTTTIDAGNDGTGAIVLGSVTAGGLNLGAAGLITDAAGATIAVAGTTGVSATDGFGTVFDVTLDSATNDFGTVTAPSVGNLTLVDATGFNFGTTNVSGNLSLTTTGLIGDTGVLSVVGTTTLAAGALNDIILDSANNFGGSVTVTTANNVTLVDAFSLDLGASTISGTLGVTAPGGLTQSGVLAVTGVATINTGANDTTLANAANTFSTVAVTGRNVSLRDADAIDLGASTVTGTLTVQSGGAAATDDITDSGALVVTGAATFIAVLGDVVLDAANDFSTLSVTSSNTTTVNDIGAINLGGVTTTTTFALTTAGAITQTGALAIGTTSTFAAGATNNITLDMATNVFGGSVGITSGLDVTLVDSGALDLSASTVSSDLSVTAAGAITDSGALTVGGQATFDAGPNAITLGDAEADNFGALSVTGGIVTVTEASAMILTTASAVALTVTAAGTITDTGFVVATGVLTATSTVAGSSVVLDSSVNTAGTVNLATAGGGAAATFVDQNGFTVGTVTAVGGLVTLTALGGAILSDGAGIDVTSTSLIVSGSTGVGILGLPLTTAVTNLEGAGGSGSFFLANTGAMTIGGLSTMEGVSAAGAIDVSTSSPLTVNEVVETDGDVTLTAGAAVDLDDCLDDLTLNASVSGHNVTLQAADEIIVNDSVTADEDLAFNFGDAARINDLITAGGTVTFTSPDGFVDDPTCPNGIFFGPGGVLFADDIAIVVAGDIELGTLKAVNTISVTSIGGSILLGNGPGDAGADVEAILIAGTSVTLRADNDIAFRLGAVPEGTAIRAGTLVDMIAGIDGTGSITDTNAVTLDLVARDVNADSAGGTTFDGQFERVLDSTNTAGAVDISNASADLVVVTVSTDAGSAVTLSTPGSILDGNAAGTTNVTAGSLSATAGSGIDLDTAITTLTLASVTGVGGIDLSDAGTLAVTAATTANGDLTITSTDDMTVSAVTAGGSGAVATLNAVGAASEVLDGNAGATNVTAGGLVALSGAGVGTGDALETNVRFFEGTGGTGGIALANAGALTLGGIGAVAGITATGAITITTASPLTVDINTTTAGTLTLTAGETGDGGVFADDLTVNAGVTVRSTGADVVLNAGDDVVLGGSVVALTTVTIRAGSGDLDAGGSVADANGGLVNVSAATLDVTAIGNDAATAIDLDTTVTTVLNAAVTPGTGGIDIQDTAGGLTVTAASTVDGDVRIEAVGGDLTASSVTAGGLGADATVVTTGTGNINVGIVVADGDVVTLDSAGNVTDTDGAGNDVTADALVALTETGFGTLADPIETTVNFVEGEGGTGGFFQTNTGDLTIGTIGAVDGVVATTDISISTVGAGVLALNVFETVASSTASVTLDAGETADGLVFADDLTVTALVQAATTIALRAGDDLSMGGTVIAGTTATLVAGDGDLDVGGSIVDANGAAENVQATTLTATAVGANPVGGFGISLDTRITTLAAATVGVGVGGLQTGGVRLDDVDGGMAVTLASAENGNVLLSATGGDLTIASDPGGGAAGVFATTTAGNDVVLSTFSNVTGVGNISLGTVSAADLVELNSVGNVNDTQVAGETATTGTVNVTATNLLARAVAGFGTAANPIETLVVTAAGRVDTGGYFQTDLAGGLTVGTVTSFGGEVVSGVLDTNLLNGAAAATIRANSPLTIAANVIMSGDVTLTAGEVANAPACIDDLLVSPGVTVESTLGNVSLLAGDDVIISAGAFVTAFGTATITAGFGDLDACGTVTNDGTVTSGSGGGGGGGPVIITAIGDILLGLVIGPNGAMITSTTGSILDGNDGEMNLVVNGFTLLSAARVIGTPDDALEVQQENGQFIANAGSASDEVSVNLQGQLEPDGRPFATRIPPGMILFNNSVYGGDSAEVFQQFAAELNIRSTGERDHGKSGFFTGSMLYLDEVWSPDALFEWDATSDQGPLSQR